tara:strand:+ start:2500 stop:3453 length:954 start_codon:yes stop_codon:yes gene_type:complete
MSVTGAAPEAAEPILSVVLIVRHPNETPDAVLSALASETEDPAARAQTEIILVDGRPDAVDPRGNLPGRLTRLLRPGLNMPLLKAEGVAVARGKSVAFLEPKAVPVEGWLRAALAAVAAHPGAALGGAVTVGPCRAADRAAYAFEYSAFSHAALARGTGTDLPGNNMVLPLAALRDLCGDILEAEGLNKPFCQARLTGGGVAIVMVPEMTVQIKTQYRLGSLLASRFRYARCFGGTRAALARPKKRWLYRLGAPLVPALLLRRHLGTALRTAGPDRLGPEKLGAGGLAALSALCLAWSAGEAAGSWAGPGKSCNRLY